MVLAAEVGGWSHEAHSFVCQLAKVKACSVPRILKGRTIQAWHHRWCSLLAFASALSLLKRRPALGCDGDAPSTSDVVSACRPLQLVPDAVVTGVELYFLFESS